MIMISETFWDVGGLFLQDCLHAKFLRSEAVYSNAYFLLHMFFVFFLKAMVESWDKSGCL